MEEKFVFITGASKGLGKALACEFALRGKNLLLVSLEGEKISETAIEFSGRFGIIVYSFETDLSKENSVYEVAEWANRYEIEVLVNNAGIGGSGRFEQAETELISRMIMINVYSTALLTRLLLPNLKRRSKSYILNISSMAAFSPIAYKTVYPATKAFILYFSRGLNEEFRNTNVFVSVIHPGPMRTNPEVVKRIERLGFFGTFGLLSPERIASIAVRQLYHRDSLIIPGILNKLNWLLIQIIPVWIRLPIVSRIFKKEIIG
jgi:short-subunit dehydrogenase